MKLVLKDVKIIEYGQLIRAPFCGKLLADLGADVIKIEKPGHGDIARRKKPFFKDIPGEDRSGLFLYLNTNKLGVTLNTEKPAAIEIFKELIKDADILIEDTEYDSMDRLGLDYNTLKSINPSLIMVSITPFGQTGPYRDYKGCDLISWHMGGIGFATPRHIGTAKQEPLRVMQMADFVTGMTAAVATLTALNVQRKTGVGQQVDVSAFEAIARMGGWITAYWPFEHHSPTRASRSTTFPYHFVKCKDGWIFVVCPDEHQWQGFVDVMGKPEWAEAELFKDVISRANHWDSLEPLISEWAKNYTKMEIFEAAKAKGVPLAPLNSVTELFENRQLAERSFFVDVKHRETGSITYPGIPYKSPGVPWSIRNPAPLLGQHNEDVYCTRLGYKKTDLLEMQKAEVI